MLSSRLCGAPPHSPASASSPIPIPCKPALPPNPAAHVQVVAATQRDNGRRVALKVVFLDNPRLTDSHAAVLRDEVDIIQSLHHPNIVTFDCVMEDPVRRQFVIAEEILLGGTLTEELGAAAANNDDRLLAHVFKQLLSALAHMHDAGVLHRDLKPENVMFRSQAHEWADCGALPVVIDFGMSARYQPTGPAIHGLLGSPGGPPRPSPMPVSYLS